jgi:aryl-alcohol dehydrogenase-like predicted oxidoreductase
MFCSDIPRRNAIRGEQLLNNPVVGTALVGFRTPAEVIENLDSLDWEISNADMAGIDVIFDRQGATTLPPG